MSPEAYLYLTLIHTGVVIGFFGAAAHILSGGPFVEKIARWLSVIWSAGVMAAWGFRVATAGHLPLFGMYESALSLALTTVGIAVFWEFRHKGQGAITPLAVMIGTALLAHGETFDPTIYALTISERSWVVDIHAVVAWLAFSVLTLSAILAFRIVIGRTACDNLARSLVSTLQVGFVLLTGMIISGSVYKFMLFGTPWSFDPVESMALVVWMAYATILHLHLFIGWRGKRLAAWTLFLFVLLAISYRGLVYFPAWSTYHIFDMDRRLHVGPEQLGIGGEDQ